MNGTVHGHPNLVLDLEPIFVLLAQADRGVQAPDVCARAVAHAELQQPAGVAAHRPLPGQAGQELPIKKIEKIIKNINKANTFCVLF